MDMNELRVKALRRVIGSLSQADFAAAHDLNASYISQILSGHRSFGERAAINMEKKIGLAPGTLSRPPLELTSKPHNEAGPVGNTEGEPIKIKEGFVPVVGIAKLGPDGFFEAIDYPVGHGDGRVLIGSSDPNAYALRVVGDSMEPRIRSGEFVVIEPNKPYVSGDEVMAQYQDGPAVQSVIKVFMHERDGFVRLLSVNDAHPPITIDRTSILKIHLVGAIARPSRYISD